MNTGKRQGRSMRNEPENARAICVLQSWLTATGITSTLHPTPNYGLVVARKSGGTIDVVVTPIAVPLSKEPGLTTVIIKASDLTGERERALKAFHEVTEATGYGSPVPVERGAVPENKLNFSDDFELVAMRHREFRNAPNIDTMEFNKKYEKVVQACSKFFYRRNRFICDTFGVTVDDLQTYARVWTCNFAHKYKKLDKGDADNGKLLNVHLQQRFANFRNILYRKTQNCLPDSEAVFIATNDSPLLGRYGITDPTREDDAADAEYRERVAKKSGMDIASIRKRRASAVSLLAKMLSELPHDRMVEVLEEAANNTFLCADAREEAEKQLKDHRSECKECCATQVDE